jgi:putative spermidine/putrescine transport system ATP-binding protein
MAINLHRLKPTAQDIAPSSRQSDEIVVFRDVGKSYDGRSQVIKGLNLSVRRGEFLTVLGPSGSGKTTCLMLLAGFEMPSSGEITLDGRPIHHLPPYKRDIGVVFQNYALFPHMTVGQNLSFPLRVRGQSKKEIADRVDWALSLVRLPGFANRKPAQLSGGQQQRVAVARALVFEPKLLLMDEPLGALDKQLREQMQYEIKELHRSLGVTVVYVTHDQSEAMTMSDRVAVFYDGAIQQLASPEALYEAPANSFVAGFVGENNRLKGTLRAVTEDLCVVDVPGFGKVKALPGPNLEVGKTVCVSVRPERVRLDPAMDCANRVNTKVHDVLYLGDHRRLVLKLDQQADIVVKVANKGSQNSVAPGQSIEIGWTTEDCRALSEAGQEKA